MLISFVTSITPPPPLWILEVGGCYKLSKGGGVEVLIVEEGWGVGWRCYKLKKGGGVEVLQVEEGEWGGG